MIIGVISDIHISTELDKKILATTIKNIANCGANALLMAGDIGESNKIRSKSFDIFLEQFPEKFHQNLLLMLGNHDVRTGAAPHELLDPDLVALYDSYLKKCNLQRQEGTMCVDTWIDGYHFICLNTDVPLREQMDLNEASFSWLEEKLAEKADINKPIFVMTHQALNFSHWRSYLYGGFGPQDERLKKLFLRYPQIVVLSGHIHNGFGIIETIQRPFGTLIDIPSLTLGENGLRDQGTGYLLKIQDDKLTFEAWNFYNNTHLSEYDTEILLPSLSTLASKLPSYTDKRVENLLSESNELMNKRYKDKYEKIYDKDTWDKINTLRNNIISLEADLTFHEMEIKNGEDITEEILTKILHKYDRVHIKTKNSYWSQHIHIPLVKDFKEIKITSMADLDSHIYVNDKEYILSKGYEFFLSSVDNWKLSTDEINPS